MSNIEDTHERSATILTSANVLTNLVDHLQNGDGTRSRVLYATDIVTLWTNLGNVETNTSTSARNTIHVLDSLTDTINIILRNNYVAIQ